jgi:subtilase family serine protease
MGPHRPPPGGVGSQKPLSDLFVGKALNVTINSYQSGGRTVFSNNRRPSVPARLGAVVREVLGLNNIEVMTSKGQPAEGAPVYSPGPVRGGGSSHRGYGDPSKRPHPETKPQPAGIADASITSSTGNNFYDPSNLWSAGGYDFLALYNVSHCCNPLGNAGSSPAQSSIAIVIDGDVVESDVKMFAGQFGLAYNYDRIFIDGTPPTPPCGDCFEAVMDLEWATAMSNSFGAVADTAHVWMYETADSSLLSDLDAIALALQDSDARVLSLSWGSPEAEFAAADFSGYPNCYPPRGPDCGVFLTFQSALGVYHNFFNQMSGQGWTIVVAAGDMGPTPDCALPPSVLYPASDPNVVAVGGTTLSLTGTSFVSENAWPGSGTIPGTKPISCTPTPSNNGGGGGGVSAYYTWPPSFPSPFANSARTLPDISLNAVYPQNVFYQAGGARGGRLVVGLALSLRNWQVSLRRKTPTFFMFVKIKTQTAPLVSVL